MNSSVGRIKIIYHPILKEMRFERYENGRWVEAGDERSILHNYVTEKNLLLQNLGNRFFQDIADSMDNISNVALDFNGTLDDYEDLKKMVVYYQSEHEETPCKISVGDLAELPSVKTLFDEVMDYSNETSDNFQKIIERVNAEGYGTEIHSICDQLEKWLGDLMKTREGLKENAVNLCFVGAYSSGKSTLINALIGESILPEAIKSETAKMFKVTQILPESHELPSVFLNLVENGSQHKVELRWDEEGKVTLVNWPQENSVRQAVQCAINESKGERRHIQMKAVLSCINKQPDAPEHMDKDGRIWYHDSYVRGIVNVRYPFDLESEVLFHIYDTPGTDSNTPAHVDTLKTALADPTSSILVYVNDTRLEGSANAILLDILSNMESRKTVGSSTIDLGRSFFVVNRADTVTKQKDLEDLQDASLVLLQPAEEGLPEAAAQKPEPLEIKLREKRLFFTDALHAGDARAVEKGIAGDAERERLRNTEKLVNTAWYHLYQYDIMAQAETDTKRLIEAAEMELAGLPNPEEIMKMRQAEWLAAYTQAVQDGTADTFLQGHPMPAKDSTGIPTDAYYICSGVYSLQKEIERYAARYALAVRTKGIIDGTRTLIRQLDRKCEEVGNDLNKNIENLDEQIKVATGALSEKIRGICKTDEHRWLSSEEAEDLGLDPGSIVTRKDSLKTKLDKTVKSVGFRQDKDLEKSINSAKFETQKALNRFFDDYAGRSENRLKKMQADLIGEIERAIDAQEALDEDTKRRLKRIQKQDISKPSQDMSDITTRDYLDHLWVFHWVKKERLIEELVELFDKRLQRSSEGYKKAYADSRSKLAGEIQEQYLNRIGEFASEIKQLKGNRDGVERELRIVVQMLESVKKRDRQLEDKIYNRPPEQGEAT